MPQVFEPGKQENRNDPPTQPGGIPPQNVGADAQDQERKGHHSDDQQTAVEPLHDGGRGVYTCDVPVAANCLDAELGHRP